MYEYEKETLGPKFIDAYQQALQRAKDLFAERASEGRNAFLPPVSMFPFGAQSHGTIIWMKTLRLMGDIETGNWQKVEEEAEDLINYSAFLKAWCIIRKNGVALTGTESANPRRKLKCVATPDTCGHCDHYDEENPCCICGQVYPDDEEDGDETCENCGDDPCTCDDEEDDDDDSCSHCGCERCCDCQEEADEEPEPVKAPEPVTQKQFPFAPRPVAIGVDFARPGQFNFEYNAPFIGTSILEAALKAQEGEQLRAKELVEKWGKDTSRDTEPGFLGASATPVSSVCTCSNCALARQQAWARNPGPGAVTPVEEKAIQLVKGLTEQAAKAPRVEGRPALSYMTITVGGQQYAFGSRTPLPQQVPTKPQPEATLKVHDTEAPSYVFYRDGDSQMYRLDIPGTTFYTRKSREGALYMVDALVRIYASMKESWPEMAKTQLGRLARSSGDALELHKFITSKESWPIATREDIEVYEKANEMLYNSPSFDLETKRLFNTGLALLKYAFSMSETGYDIKG